MRWDEVAQAVASRMAGDATLVGIYGEQIRMGSDDQDRQVPSLEYMLLPLSVTELWQPHLITFMQWSNSMTDLATSDRALHRLFDHELPVVIEGVAMWAQFEDGGELTGPDREGYFGLSSRFRFTPVRGRLLPGRSS